MRTITLILLSCFIISVNCLVSPDEFGELMKNKVAEMHTKCQRYSAVPEELIDEMKDGKFPEVQSAKRYVACAWTLNGPMDRDYKIDPLKLLNFLHHTHSEDGFEYVRCNREALASGLKSEELFWNMQKCIQKSVDKSHYIFM